jgi:hypothetical protein
MAAGAGVPPPVDSSIAGAPGGGGDWEAAAQPAAPQQPAAAQTPNPASGGPSTPAAGSQAQAGVQPTDAKRTDTIPSQPAPVQPALVTSQKRGGLLGVMDDIANALTGKTTPEIGTDADGNKYVKQDTLSRGQQWVRIGAGLLGGAAKGWAAGKGRNPGAAAAAGFDQGQQMRQQEQQAQTDVSNQVDKENLARANMQKLNMDMAEHSWNLTYMQHKAMQEDIDFNQKQVDRLTKPVSEGGEGGQILGIMRNPNDIDQIMKVDPNVWDALINKGTIRNPPHYDADGKVDGNYVIKMPTGYGSGLHPPGQEFQTLDPATGKPVVSKTSDWTTDMDLDTLHMAYNVNKAKYDHDKAQQDLQASETAEHNANATKVPSEIAKNAGETAQARAGAVRDYAGAAKDMEDVKTAKGKEAQAGDPALVDSIGTGKIVSERMAYLLSRNPQLVDAVTAKYPDFDSSKAESYPAIYKDFTSGKTSVALNSGATALEHLQKLQTLNTPASHIPGTPAYNAYHNQLDTLAPELAKFYGDTTVPAIAALKSTLGATLPGNRQAAIETQAQSMGKKFDNYEQQWRNAAPSASYEAPLPGVSDKAKDARAALDPEYRQQRVQEIQGATRTPAASNPQQLRAQATQAGVPATATAIAHDAQGRVVGYQDATGYHGLGGH